MGFVSEVQMAGKAPPPPPELRFGCAIVGNLPREARNPNPGSKGSFGSDLGVHMGEHLAVLGVIWGSLGVILGSFESRFGDILRPFGGHWRIILGSPWNQLGVHLGVIWGSF